MKKNTYNIDIRDEPNQNNSTWRDIYRADYIHTRVPYRHRTILIVQCLTALIRALVADYAIVKNKTPDTYIYI